MEIKKEKSQFIDSIKEASIIIHQNDSDHLKHRLSLQCFLAYILFELDKIKYKLNLQKNEQPILVYLKGLYKLLTQPNPKSVNSFTTQSNHKLPLLAQKENVHLSDENINEIIEELKFLIDDSSNKKKPNKKAYEKVLKTIDQGRLHHYLSLQLAYAMENNGITPNQVSSIITINGKKKQTIPLDWTKDPKQCRDTIKNIAIIVSNWQTGIICETFESTDCTPNKTQAPEAYNAFRYCKECRNDSFHQLLNDNEIFAPQKTGKSLKELSGQERLNLLIENINILEKYALEKLSKL